MWGALFNLGARYAFFRRWKNAIVFAGGVLLCAVAAFLIDAEKYLSAGFIGVLAAALLLSFAAHYLREQRAIRERERQKREKIAKRAAAAGARSEKIERVKATAAGVAKGVSGRATSFANVAKTGFAGARDKLGSWRNK